MGNSNIAGAAAAIAASPDLPADADHDDVDRPSHLWRSLALGFVLLAWWLVAVSSGPDAFATVNNFFATILGRFVLFMFSWALIHHMLGGIRHLIWDTGRCLDKTSIEIFAWGTIIGSTVLTVPLWIVGYWLRGGA